MSSSKKSGPSKSSSPEALAERREKARWARILKVYGITKEQYDEIYRPDCVICLRPFGGTVKPVIDHSHRTGHVRGIICGYCNHRMVGRHNDSAVLRRIADYLDAPTKGWVVPPKVKRKRKKKI